MFPLSESARLFAQNECYPEISYTSGEVIEASKCGDFTITMEVGSETSLSTASSAFPNVNNLNGYNLLVKGTFTLDKDMAFVDCRIFFNENALLVTSGTVKLTGVSSQFLPCGDKTWQGMIINNNGAISLNECIVLGADIALSLKKGYRTTQSALIHNSFWQNRICIFGNESLAKISFSDFYGNLFSGAGTLPGQSTVKPFAGVQVSNCTVNLGSIVYYPADDPDITQEAYYEAEVNKFTDFQFGIDATGGTVAIRNCWFHNMRPAPDANGVAQGCGISVVNSRLSVSGQDDAANHRVLGFCKFSYCAFAGIKSKRSRLDVNFAQFSAMQPYGIRSEANNSRPHTINRCKFVCNGNDQIAGISIERPWGPVGTTACNVTGNSFTGSGGDGFAGIEVTCVHPAAATMTISDNRFEMNGSTSGGYFFGIIVYGNQSGKIKILRNNLDITGGAAIAEFGIFLANFEGTGHELSDNTSTGVINCNYHIEKARNVKYCNNASDHALNGFHFYGDDVNTNWAVNGIGAHARGLYIQDIPNASNGKIGLQTRKGNTWEADDNYYGEFAAKCDALPNESLFIVEEQNDNSIFPQKTLPQDDWFKFVQGTLDHCGTGVGAFVSDFEYRFAEGTINISNYKNAELWEVKRMLLRTLMDNPSEADDDGVLESYLSHEWNSTAAKFARVERRIADYSFANAATVTHLESAYTQFDSLRKDIDALSQTSAGSSLSDKLTDMALVTDTISALLTGLEQSEQTYLQQMLDTIAAISVTQYYEQAWKTLKTYEVKINMGQTPASAGLDDLEDIAYGDQEALGAAVRHAWYHLPGCERYGLIAPDEGSEERGHIENGSLQRSFLRISPNPATEQIMVTRSELCYGSWILVNSVGLTTRSGTFDENIQTLTIDVRSAPSGVYYFVLSCSTGALQTKRLVISK